MVVGALIALRSAFSAAVAVGDDRHPGSRSGGVHRSRKVAEAGACRLNEQDVTVRAHRAGHIEIESLFLVPTRVDAGIIALHATLVDLLETAIGGRARGETVRRTVGGQIRFSVVVAVGVDDRDRGRRAAAGDVVRRTKVRRSIAARSPGIGAESAIAGGAASVRHDVRKAACGAQLVAVRADGDMIGVASTFDLHRLSGSGICPHHAKRQPEGHQPPYA